MQIRTAMKKHWEDVPMDTLRKMAPKFGIMPRRLHKADLIHAMRTAYWEDRETTK